MADPLRILPAEPAELNEPSAAQVVQQANRLHALKSAPGFHDLKLICGMLIQEAQAATDDYNGRDREELFELNVRKQVAKLLVNELFSRIDSAIAAASGLPGFQLEDPRPPVIATRIAGSY